MFGNILVALSYVLVVYLNSVASITSTATATGWNSFVYFNHCGSIYRTIFIGNNRLPIPFIGLANNAL